MTSFFPKLESVSLIVDSISSLLKPDLAEVAKRTVERIEGGASAQMSSMIRVLRVLDLMPGLDRMIPEAGPGPMDLLKRKGKLRQRASASRRPDRPAEPWTWGDKK